MNKRVLLILVSALMSFIALRAERVMVIADPHVIASSLLQPGQAQEDMLASSRKMLDLSEPAFLALIDTALKYKPDLVLLPGDLTKDGEKASHELVAQQLARLEAESIQVLVMPGNHDIDNPSSYAYYGDDKQEVPTISDAQFDSIYAAFMPQGDAVRDANSHSYVAEPFEGISIISIDGADGNASVGSLSEKTLQWVLDQADSAKAKGNNVIAMSHWQLINHFDGQGSLVSSCQMENASAIAKQLAEHGVRLVLTGHFHINGVTTAFYNNDNVRDSLVEITTGSPITYPCPYRWLTISDDRTTVSVQTDNIMALAEKPELQPYSREWQRIHTENMVPQMALSIWNTMENYVTQLKTNPLYQNFIGPVEACIPQTDSAKIALVDRYMKSSIVDLYVLHSDANEPERPEKDSIVDAFYLNLDSMMADVLTSGEVSSVLQKVIIPATDTMMSVTITSISEDETSSLIPMYINRTDDLQPVLQLYSSHWKEAIDQVLPTVEVQTVYDILGRPVREQIPGQVVISGGEKRIRKAE